MLDKSYFIVHMQPLPGTEDRDGHPKLQIQQETPAEDGPVLVEHARVAGNSETHNRHNRANADENQNRQKQAQPEFAFGWDEWVRLWLAQIQQNALI